MKDIVCYLQDKKIYHHDVMDREFELELDGSDVLLRFNDDEWIIPIGDGSGVEREIRDILEDEYKIEIRFCDHCGIPIDCGYMIDDGSFYSCEECFEDIMDKYYGKDGWRDTDEEGEWGGYYEWLKSDGTWEDTGIFWTEWY